MALKRLTHERYSQMQADGTWDEYRRSLAERLREKGIAPRFPEAAAAPPGPLADDDLPAIEKETHPAWWQVRRIEQDAAGQKRQVLIYESRDETTAMKVCMAQKYRCRVMRWGDKRQPFENFKPIKLTATEQCMPADGEGRR